MNALTTRQKLALDCIRNSIAERGIPPTLREIGEVMGIRSTNGVCDHLRALERKGFLKRGMDAKSRDMRLVEDSPITAATSNGTLDAVEVNVYSRICQSGPVLYDEHVVDRIAVDARLVEGGQQVFGFRVAGEAMSQMGIMPGDYVIVRHRTHAERGAVVVALVGDDAMVRLFYPERDYIRLQPASPNTAPVLVRTSDWKWGTMLVGRVIGLWRRFT